MSNNDSFSDNADDDILSEFKPKIKQFFSSSHSLSSKDDLDEFLDSCGLLEIWNSEEEKATVWTSLCKHRSQSGSITYESVIKGLQDLFTEANFGENNSNNNSVNERTSSLPNIRPSKLEELSSFASSIDNDKYLQLKKISILLDINNRTSISVSDIQEMLSKHKFIKLTFEDMQEFLKLIGYYHKQTKNYEIDQILYESAIAEMEKKLSDEQNMFEYGNDLIYGNKGSLYEDVGEEQDAIEVIEDIAQKEAEMVDVLNVLLRIKNEFYDLNNNVVNKYERFINGEEEKLEGVEGCLGEIEKKGKEYDLFVKDISGFTKSKNGKIEMLKTLIFKQNNKMKVMEDEYRQLYQQFTNNQQLDIDDEMERLIDENVILTRDKEEQNDVIDKLRKELENKENIISSYQIQCSDLTKEREQLQSNIQELTTNNEKLKNEYDVLVNNVLDKIKKDEEQEREQEQFNRKALNLPEEPNTMNNQTSNNPEQNDAPDNIEAIDITKMTIPQLNQILQSMKFPILKNFALKVSYDFQNISKSMSEKTKILNDLSSQLEGIKTELSSLKLTNSHLQNENNTLKSKLESYKSEAEVNSCFRPSNVLGNNIRLSRMSHIDIAGTKNIYTPSSYTNISSAAFFSEKKAKHVNINVPTQANAVNAKGNIDEIQEGNEDEEEDKDKNNQNAKKRREDDDEDHGDLELTSNIRNIPIEKEKRREYESSKLIENIFGTGINDSSPKTDKAKTSRHKPSKSFGLQTPFSFNTGLSNSFNMEDSDDNANENSDNGSVQIKASIPDPVIEDDDINRGSVNIKESGGDDNEASLSNFVKINEGELQGRHITDNDKFKHRKKIMKKYNTNSNFKVKGIENPSLQTKMKDKVKDDESIQHDMKFLDMEGIDPHSMKNKSSATLPFQEKRIAPLEEAIHKTNIHESVNKEEHTKISLPSLNIPKDSPAEEQPSKESKHKLPSTKGHARYKSSLGLNQSLTARNYRTYGLASIKEEKPLTKDFLNVGKSKVFIKILEKRNDKTTDDKIFSDHVFDIEWNDRKNKATLIMTPNGLYLLNPDDFSEKLYHQRKTLTTIILTTKNPNFITFYFEDGEDMCLETMRRLEMLYYIRDNIRWRSAGKKVPIRYQDNVIVSKKGKKFNVNVTGKLFIGTGNFECAQKFGYLYKYDARILGSKFTEKLLVLTNVGLLYYDYVNKPPKKLIPIVGSKISVIHGHKYKMACTFEIKTNMNEFFIFAAASEADRDSWVDELKKVQKIYEEKMKTIDTIVKRSEEIIEDIKEEHA